MHFYSYLLAFTVALTASVEAHSMASAMFVNGKGVGDGTCMRLDKNATTNFVEDISSDEMSCGATGIPRVRRTCPINAGDSVSFRWKRSPGSNDSLVIVTSHNGPCSVYMKQMSTDAPAADGSFPNETPAGDGWFKVAYDGQDSSGRWCIDRLRDTSNGVVSFKVPSDLKSGYYLIRPELLSLHQARYGRPQFYVGCAQVYITGSTGTATPETVAIPGYVNTSMPAMNYNIYLPQGPFPGYGPPLYKGSDDSTTLPSLAGSSIADSTSASLPAATSAVNNKAASSTAAVPVSLTTFSTVPLPEATTIDGPASQTMAPFDVSPCSAGKAKRHTHLSRHRNVRRDSSTDPFACPSGTILEVGNLCLPEITDWNDSDDSMTNCLASENRCFNFSDVCFNQTNAAVNQHSGHGCTLYKYKCDAVEKYCQRKTKQGPADLNAVLTEPKQVLDNWGLSM